MSTRDEGWNNLQARVEYLTQTLFNVRDANTASGRGIDDAPLGMRAALNDLTHEVSMWEGKLAGVRGE
jgi:hypothetical protein